ncbi:MAG: MoaD/ThiS family protein [Gammaproteobacteria bacterium]|nr:MoaD/ThiS family protein [Gammaproteobacteria bacterium]
MNITLKLFSNLMEYLPKEADSNTVNMVVSVSTSPYDLIDRLGIPRGEAQVMMKNGEFCPIEQRSYPLNDGDTVSVWPSIQGG